MKKAFFSLVMVTLLTLSACASPTGVGTTQPSPSDQVVTVVAAPMQAFPTITPTPTAQPTCPEPTEGTKLLRNEAMGYCLLYPADYIQVDPLAGNVCLIPVEIFLLCHNAVAQFNVEDAAGRSLSQVTDENSARGGNIGEPSSLTIAGEEAILFPEVAGQASARVVIAVHDDRLYSLAFGLPDPADPESVERFDFFYNTVIESFTFLPVQPGPEPTEAPQGTRGSAVVAYIKDGDLLVWEEATGQSRTVFDSGDVVRIELSGDAQLVAFVRRTLLDGDPQYGRSALWVVGRDGANPRELVSDAQLRARLGASDSDDTDFLALAWVPNSHRLLYSVSFFPTWGAPQGLYLVDADSQASAELVPAEVRNDFASSPDGEHIAVVTSDDLFFVSVDDSLAGEVVTTYPAGGVPGNGPYNFGSSGEVSSLRAWTQDSTAVIVRRGSGKGSRYTIWRVPVDGGPAETLIAFQGDNEQLAPDGSMMTFVRGLGPDVSGRFVVPLPEDLGPFAAVPLAWGLSWSPGGQAYAFESLAKRELLPLCPNAGQAIDVCGPPIRFGELIEALEWIDRERYLYMTAVPRRLMLGSLDGPVAIIAEDPQDLQGASAVASTCRDNSEFVSDVTVPDGTHMAPDTVFKKTWRIRNTGDCAWDDSYRLTFLSGDRLSGPRSVPLGQKVEPGEEVDVSVVLITPPEAGTYQGQWQLFAPDGTPFGANVYVAIVVP